MANKLIHDKTLHVRAARESDFPGFREVGKLESISRPVSSGIGKFVNKFFYPTSKRHTVTSPPPFMGSAQLFLFWVRYC